MDGNKIQTKNQISLILNEHRKTLKTFEEISQINNFTTILAIVINAYHLNKDLINAYRNSFLTKNLLIFILLHIILMIRKK